MSPCRAISPREMLLRWLGGRPGQSRCEWIIDPDRLVEWHELEIVDRTSRVWQRLLYSGDDLSFRRACRNVFAEAETSGKPVLIVVTRGSASKEPVDISYITDILGRAEGKPLDLSMFAFFKSVFPKVNPPQDVLREYKGEFLDCVPSLPRAYVEFKQRWGEPDNWSRAQFLSMLVLARHPEFRLDEVYCDDPNIPDFVVHVCRLIMNPTLSSQEHALIWRMVRESMLVKEADVEPWLDLEVTDLAGYLILRDFASRQSLQNPVAQLQGKFSFRFDVDALEPLVDDVIRRLRRDKVTWEQINLQASAFCRERACVKVLDLLPNTQSLSQAVLDETTSPVLLRDILARIFQGFMASPEPGKLGWVKQASSHPLLARSNPTETEREGTALLECLIRVQRVEEQLGQPLPPFESLRELLEWYCNSGTYLLELDVSEAFHYAEHITDPATQEQVEAYFHQAPKGLKRRLRLHLDELDAELARLLRADPAGFVRSEVCATSILANTVIRHMPGAEAGRVWILIFDGMRFDSWARVIKPLLSEYFELIEERERAYLAVMPSRTYEARRSLLSGATASEWKTPSGKPTTDERLLVARSLGLTGYNLKDLRLLSEAQTVESRRKLGFRDSDVRRFNVLIYPISDELVHRQKESLAGINAKIKQDMLGDKKQYLRGILDDLLTRVSPHDVLLVTSDHGFIEMTPEKAIQFSEREVQAAGRRLDEAVQYRCLVNFDRSDLQDVVRVQWDEDMKYVLPIGSAWFRRESGKSAKYAHGGVSLAELVVPGSMFRRITEKLTRVEIEDLPQVLDVPEDESVALEFVISNIGNMNVDVEVAVSTNLGEQLLSQRLRLDPGMQEKLKAEVVGRYAADRLGRVISEKTTKSITVVIRNSDLAGRMTEPPHGRSVIPVSVVPKAAKIETDALKGFDNI